MELLFPGMTMLAAAAGFTPQLPTNLSFSLSDFLTPSFLILFACGQVVTLLSVWLVSRMIVDYDGGTFANAVKVWFFTLLAFGAILAGLVFAFPMVAASHDQWRIGLVLFGGGMLMLTVALLIPAKVYTIGFLRAFAIVVLSTILEMIVQFGLQLTVLKDAAAKNQVALMQIFAGSFAHQAASAPNDEAAPAGSAGEDRAPSNEIDALLTTALHPVGPAPSLEQQEAQVAALQQKLQARRNTLPPGDPQALAVFQNELNRYLYFLNQVTALRRVKSGTPAPAGTHSPAH